MIASTLMAFNLAELDEALVPVAGWLGTFALHSTIALAAAWLIVRVRKQRSLGLQDALLRQAMWVPLFSSTLQYLFFGSIWSTLLAAPAVTPAELAQLMPQLLAQPEAIAEAGPVEVAAPVPYATIAVGVALLLSLTGFVWLWRTWRQLTRILATRCPETDPRVLSAAATMATRLGLRQSPHISRAEQLSTPIAFGFVRPEICLPARAAGLDDASLRAMLGHELAHLRRADPAWMWLAAWIHALFPWQLLLVSVRRQWSRIVELRCDSEAAQHTSPTAVARCLVEVAEWLRPQFAQPVVALGMAARPSALRERVEAALGATKAPAPRRLVASGMAVVSLAAMTVAAPGLGDEVRTGLSADDFLFAFEEQGDDAAEGLRPFLVLVEQDYQSVVSEAASLQRMLRFELNPQSRSLQDALQRRLSLLSQLRARLMARVNR